MPSPKREWDVMESIFLRVETIFAPAIFKTRLMETAKVDHNLAVLWKQFLIKQICRKPKPKTKMSPYPGPIFRIAQTPSSMSALLDVDEDNDNGYDAMYQTDTDGQDTTSATNTMPVWDGDNGYNKMYWTDDIRAVANTKAPSWLIPAVALVSAVLVLVVVVYSFKLSLLPHVVEEEEEYDDDDEEGNTSLTSKLADWKKVKPGISVEGDTEDEDEEFTVKSITVRSIPEV
jgi:hypothetical protein